MTMFTLSELGCNGDCKQGRYPCTCQRGVAIETKLEPDVYHIPFYGTYDLSKENEK